MTRAVWDDLLAQAKAAHQASDALNAFCPFPDDLSAQDVDPFHIPPSDLLQAETGFARSPYARFCAAIAAGAPAAHWRETYKDTDIGQDFMDRFGCYCLIGAGGPFRSDQMAAWIVYMPARLHYPWHHHPGEEMYLVIGGEAEFFRRGEAPETLYPGDTSQHISNQPHAMETHDSPVMCYVTWRNGFGTPPVLTRDAS